MEKENPNLITVFICFLRSGLRFTRYDTNNVGLAFIEEIKKHNPSFKPEKVQQKERDQIYTVNAYPKEFEQLILSLIEEYRKKNKLEYRLKKPRSGGGSYNRGGGSRQGGGYSQNRDQRSPGGYSPPRRDGQSGAYSPRRDNDGGYPARRNIDNQSGQGSYRPRENQDGSRARGIGTYRPVRDQEPNPDGNSPNSSSADRGEDSEHKRPRRPRKDTNE